jgi:hypothetical protein
MLSEFEITKHSLPHLQKIPNLSWGKINSKEQHSFWEKVKIPTIN